MVSPSEKAFEKYIELIPDDPNPYDSYAELLMQFLILRNRLPNKGETKEFFDIIKRRYPEILKEIKREKKSMFFERDDEVISASEIELDHIESESK